MWQKFKNIFKSAKNIFQNNKDFDAYKKDLEELLIKGDITLETTRAILRQLKKTEDADEATAQLKTEIVNILKPCEKEFSLPQNTLQIILICGVNGSGKTTTIAKLVHFLLTKGFTYTEIGLVAGDTFRAAATEQLAVWAQRLHVQFYTGTQDRDPATVAYQSVDWAKANHIRVLIIDTAGRLQNKSNLMDELSKIRRVLQKQLPQAPHETLLVLDGTTGSNAVSQAKLFHEIAPITGLVMTKLDGTAKGGTLISIAASLKLPIYFLGTGEKQDDLHPFSSEEFIVDLFD